MYNDPEQALDPPHEPGLDVTGICHVCGDELLRQDKEECEWCGEIVCDKCIIMIKHSKFCLKCAENENGN